MTPSIGNTKLFRSEPLAHTGTVKDNAYVAHKYVKIYCVTNQSPELPFCGPHPKPHGARGLSEHYHLLDIVT